MNGVRLVAPELRADGTIAPAAWGYEPTGDGWRVLREGVSVVELGPGYRPLRVSHAGICATDLARVHLPFPLPQVTGHEVVALDDDDRPVLVEINASHRARGLPEDAWCARCRAGLDTHCPDRMVLGIDRLVGGFAPWILAPVRAIVPVPPGLDPTTAVLAEPFAAAWHAVETIDASEGWTVAVLGLGRLGLLLVAALDAWRLATGRAIAVVGVARGTARAALARRLGADRIEAPGAAPAFDVVVDATGSAEGLATALALARRVVHLKSTSGVPAVGLSDPTALVVDEIAIEGEATATSPAACPPGSRTAVVDRVAAIDAAVGPRGRIVLSACARDDGPLGRAVIGRGVRVETSRCGSIPASLPALAAIDERLGTPLGGLLTTATVPAARLAEGYALARSPAHVKIVVRHSAG